MAAYFQQETCSHTMLILVFKAVNNLLPTYLSDLFIIRENIKES